MLSGGFLEGSTTLVVGTTGSGKTTLALQFALEGLKRGEPTLYVNFQENPAQLRRAIENLGGNLDSAHENGFGLLYASPVELQIDSIVVEIFDAIKQRAVRRLVIDAVGDLAAAASDPQRLHDYLYSLIQHFTARGITTMLTLESGEGFTGMSLPMDQRFSYMSDNLIHLGWKAEGPEHRTLRIVKTRGSGHDGETRHFDIAAEGVRIT